MLRHRLPPHPAAGGADAALPWSAWQRGLRRYGFHGLSYEYIATALAERHGREEAGRARTVVAHLGSGASLCALQGLKSVATTMGFSALDGLMMGTRTGALDPGAVIYLMEIEKLSLAQVGRALYHESGLLGISGLSSDPRVLLAREGEDSEAGERCRAALELYVRRIVREIGALAAVLGGLDRLVFTAGGGRAQRGDPPAGVRRAGVAGPGTGRGCQPGRRGAHQQPSEPCRRERGADERGVDRGQGRRAMRGAGRVIARERQGLRPQAATSGLRNRLGLAPATLRISRLSAVASW
ncbi:MAG: hypothetical protein QM757_20295 [Paludibaculum sp.]